MHCLSPIVIPDIAFAVNFTCECGLPVITQILSPKVAKVREDILPSDTLFVFTPSECTIN